MENGNLVEFLAKQPDIDFLERLRMARETCSAMRYLHYQDILHLDLKATNLLLDSNGNLKLSDFGLSRVHHSGESLSFAGSTPVMAPELFSENATPTKQCDVYSFGCLLYFLATLRQPWEGLRLEQIMFKVSSGERYFLL